MSKPTIFVHPDFFTFHAPAEKAGNSLYICANCPSKIKSSGQVKTISVSDISRQNLYSHLSSKHPGLLSSFKAACLRGESQPKKRKCDDVVDLDGIENNPSKRQATIQESLTFKLRKPPKPVLTQEEFDNVVLNYVVDSVLPLRHVETDPFRELMKNVSPNYVVMCRKTLAKRLLAKYITAKEKIIDHLLKLNHVCTTADLWTAHGKSYVGMTCHWLHPTTFERNSICLAIRRVVGRHTYNVIASSLDAINVEFGVENKTVLTITDSGSNMLKAFKLFGAEPVINEPDSAEEDDCFNGEDVVRTDLDFALLNIDSEEELYRLPMHSPCAAHLLSLLAKADADSALSNAQFKKKSRSAIGKLQGIFNKQQRSSLSKDKIKELLGTLFVIPNDTRWNAWFDAVKHVHNLVSDLVTVKKVKSNLKAVCEFLKIPVLTSEDYLFISEYVSVMTPVSYALDVLQGEQHTQVSSGYLLPTIVVIRRRLAELALKEPPLAICKPLVEALQEGLSKRFDRFFKLEYFQLAAALHPKFKLNWLDYQDEEDLKLKNQIITRIETKLQAIDAEKSSSLNKSVSPEDERDFFTLLSKGGKQENFSNSVWKMELSRYLESKNTAELSCLNQFPLIKQLFHYYNVGLPGSAACERLFSLGGRILTPMRTLLGDINFEMLVFLRSNKKVVDSH